jgi:hypothetical protein
MLTEPEDKHRLVPKNNAFAEPLPSEKEYLTKKNTGYDIKKL